MSDDTSLWPAWMMEEIKRLPRLWPREPTKRLRTLDERPLLEIAGFFTAAGTAIFLVSFGIVINNTSKGGEQKVGTMMLCVGFLMLLWSTIVFFRSHWPLEEHRSALIALLVIVILLLLVVIIAGIRIWVPFGHAPKPVPQPVYSVPAPCARCH